MKKLISVFAAVALVGSIAAAPKKPAAKPAAKPAVAAPAAAAPVAAVAASMPKSSGGGIGLFIEGRGGYSLSNGTSSAQASGDQTSATVTYQLSNASGFGGGGTIGYNIVKGLGLVASFDYRSIKSRKWSQTNQQAGAVAFGDSTQQTALGTVQATAGIGGSLTNTGSFEVQNTKNTMVLGIGFRPSMELGPGSVYAGAGFAYVLPYDDTTTGTFSAGNSTVTSGSGERVIKYGSAIGAYGELGYNFNITDNIYVGLGIRLLVTTANNSGKTATYTSSVTTSAGTVTAVTTYNVVETTNTANVSTGTTSGNTRTVTGGEKSFGSDGTTDLTGTVSVGVRF